MYIPGYSKLERQTREPNLMRALRPEPKQFAELGDRIDVADTVGCGGVRADGHDLPAFLNGKMSLHSLQDIG